MAALQPYIAKIPQIEGTKVTEGDYQGHPTRYGVSAALVKDATGKTVSDDFIRGASFNDATIQAAIKFVWDSQLGSQIDSQPIAELIVDHAYNTGRSRAVCHLQNFLVTKFGANITADGKISAATIGALNTAIKQYGEGLVYRSFRQLRANYYMGKAMTRQGTCNYWQGCGSAACAGLIDSRLNRYFPIIGQTGPDDDPEKRMSAKLASTTVATISVATSSNKIPLAICVFLLVSGLCYYFLKPKF